MKKRIDKINIEHKIIAVVSAVAGVLLLGVFFIIAGSKITPLFVSTSMVVTLIFVIIIIKNTDDLSNLGFSTPFVLFLYYTAMMMRDEWSIPYYLLICLCFSGISCLFSNFRKTVKYVIIQNILIGLLIFTGFPVIGHGISMFITVAVWLVSIFGIMVLLFLTRSATVLLNDAVTERNYFRSLLSTTENYVTMVDDSNRIIYVSNILLKLVNVEDSNLVRGRFLIDLFPVRELKLLAGRMLMQKRKYAGDWEFILNGKKRFFKALSVGLPGTRGTLINLHDLTYLAERDEIAVMKDSLKIGLFFMDGKFIIQDHYSKYLEEILDMNDISGESFTDLLSSSLNTKELDSVKDYFEMILNRYYDQEILNDINPLNEFQYKNVKTGEIKVFHCEFATVEKDRGEVFILVTIYDVTAKTELQQRLLEEENKRQEEMQAIFELIQVDYNVFIDFLGDTEYEFSQIEEILKNDKYNAHEALVEIYQSIHAIKSNAVILGLNTFGNKVHLLESQIKKMREQEEEVKFDDMLHLSVEIEKLFLEKDNYKLVLDKLKSFKKEGTEKKQSHYVFIESLTKTTNRVASDMGKKIKFIAANIDSAALDKGPRRVMKEILIQLIRNSVVHGIETPEERTSKGKKETGVIQLSIKCQNENIHIMLGDNGRGLDYKKISEKALMLKLIGKEDKENKNLLLKAIFSPGFSTADDEGLHAGRGIGLNLVRDRLREVKGSIKIQSESGKGTVFILLIPIEWGTALGM